MEQGDRRNHRGIEEIIKNSSQQLYDIGMAQYGAPFFATAVREDGTPQFTFYAEDKFLRMVVEGHIGRYNLDRYFGNDAVDTMLQPYLNDPGMRKMSNPACLEKDLPITGTNIIPFPISENAKRNVFYKRV